MSTIANESEYLAHVEATTQEQAKRHVYKYTDCGAWLEFHAWGIRVGSIVEGCDCGTAAYSLRYPFTAEEYDARIAAIEAEASALWEEANRAEGEA
jgi:hypothetical protein